MAGRKAVKDAVVAYLSPTVSDTDSLAFLYWVYWRWVNEANITGIVMKDEWWAFIDAGRPFIDTKQGDGLTWAAIKAL
jgi:hypothetical protein